MKLSVVLAAAVTLPLLLHSLGDIAATAAEVAEVGSVGSNMQLFQLIDSSKELESVSKGMQAAKQLLKMIRSKEFALVLDIIGIAGGPIAGTVTGVLKLILGSGSGGGADSEEIKFARQAFAEINEQLESFTNDFREVKELIDWNAIQVSYGTYERSVRALKSQLQLLVEAPPASTEDMRQLFIMKFESNFQNAAEKIYDGIVNGDMIFARNLLEASAKFTGNHRRQIQTFGMGLTQLLLQAVELEMAYFDLKYADQETSDYVKAVWNNRMLALKAKMESFDKTVESRWETQVSLDADQLIQEHRHMSNSELTSQLYFSLVDKFYWRWFGVFVYDATTDRSKQGYIYCKGYRKLAVSGKNILISSADKEQSIFDKSRAYWAVRAMKPTEKDASHILGLLHRELDGGDFEASCQHAQLKLVTADSLNAYAASPGDRSLYEHVCVSSFWGTSCYNVVVFG